MTQKQIADRLGVSRQLVGHALRGDGRVAESTRRQILELAQEQGYNAYSNQEARQMIARRYGKRPSTNIIAVLFNPSFDSRPLTTIPFFMSFFDGLEQECNLRRLDLMLCPVRWPELPRLVQSRQVDGVVRFGLPRSYDEKLAELQLPCVSLNHAVPEALSLQVRADSAMTEIASHLLGHGHRRFAYAGYENRDCLQRLQVFSAYCAAAGCPLDPALIDNNSSACSQDEGYQAALRLLRQREKLPFTALICANDLMAMGAHEALRQHGYSVPDDVSLVGFDDVSAFYNFRPLIASVSFDRRRMGARAIEFLWTQVQTGQVDSFEPGIELFDCQFVIHESTGPALLQP